MPSVSLTVEESDPALVLRDMDEMHEVVQRLVFEPFPAAVVPFGRGGQNLHDDGRRTDAVGLRIRFDGIPAGDEDIRVDACRSRLEPHRLT